MGAVGWVQCYQLLSWLLYYCIVLYSIVVIKEEILTLVIPLLYYIILYSIIIILPFIILAEMNHDEKICRYITIILDML